MNTQIVRSLLLCVPLVLVGALSAVASSGGTNTTDANGLRQGYWVIKGYMTPDVNYDANEVVEEGSFVDNRKEGLWKHYMPNGELRSEIHYVRNRPNGPYTIYYTNGQIEEQGNWSKSRNTGTFKRFYENGNPQQIFAFSDNGKRNGVQQYFHENGQLELEVNIVNGKEEGLMSRYYANGALKEEKDLSGGMLEHGSIRRFDRNGNPADQVEAPDVDTPAELEGEVETEEILVDIPKDAPKTEAAADEPNGAHSFRPNGYNILYNHNRQLTQIGDFRNGRLWDGKWHRYNTDGILVRIEVYKAGRYVGTGVLEEDDQ